MARTLSLKALEAVFAQQTDEVFLFLLTLSHADLAESLRVTNNSVNILSNGELYTAYPFTLTLPSEQEGQITTARLTIDNIDRMIVEAIESISTAATVEFSLIRAEEPDVLEAGPWTYRLRDISYDSYKVEGILSKKDILSSPWPGHAYTPGKFPALF